MLVMRRREGESIMIGEEVEIRILSIDGARVKIGITAPRSIPVTARELDLVRRANQSAAAPPPGAAQLLASVLKLRISSDEPEEG